MLRQRRGWTACLRAATLSGFLPPDVLAQAGPAAQARCDQLRHEAPEALARFAALAEAEGVASFEHSLAEDEVGCVLALRAR